MASTRTRTLAQLARGVRSGVLATAAMTLSAGIEGRYRGEVGHPVDYDSSDHVVTAVETVVRRPARGRGEQRAYFAAAHWGYGSLVAGAYRPIRSRTGSPAVAAGVFFVGCQAMAMTLFPLVGGTPPPYRWRRDMVLSSLLHHAVYTAVVVAADRRPAATDSPNRV